MTPLWVHPVPQPKIRFRFWTSVNLNILEIHQMLEKGLVQIYTSKSNHMNFAPIGLSLRAAGQGLRSFVICFSPHELMEGVRTASLHLKPNLIIDYSAVEQSSSVEEGNDHASYQILNAFQRAKEAVFSGDFDIVILNSILHVLEQDLLPLEEIITLIEKKPKNVELVLSGTGASEELIEKADLVTEMVVHHLERPVQSGKRPDRNGVIEVITGKGKGKTTYCLGKGLLTSCMGMPVLVFQFIKSPRPYGEVKAIKKIPHLEIKTMGRGFLNKHSPYLNEKHKKAARQAWELWLRQIYSQDYEFVVMDEINIATHHGLINAERVREMLLIRPHKFHILLSGRNAHPEVMQVASSVIEMREIKHPFQKGIRARKGIEY